MANYINDVADAIEAFQNQEGLHNYEGKRGIIALAKIARAIGYKDRQNFGQLEMNACIGDLIEFLEDNSGAIEAVIVWIAKRNSVEWLDSLKEQLVFIEEEDEDEDE